MTLFSIVHTVSDLAAAKAVHTALLGQEPHTDQPWYVGFNVGGVEIGLTPLQPDQEWSGPVAYWLSEDLDADVAKVQAAGATVTSGPTQVAPTTRLAVLQDKDGNPLGLIQQS